MNNVEKFYLFVILASIFFWSGFLLCREINKAEYKIELERTYMTVTNEEGETTKVKFGEECISPIEQYFINDNE